MSVGGDGRVLAVVGATGTGKSDLSLAIADTLAEAGRRAEIVNADAMQLYRGMDIGTAKLALEERRGHPHHQLDVLDVVDEASVAAYQRHARADIDAIVARGAVPVLVGGSGLYVSSVLFPFEFPARDEAVRARLEKELDERGPGALYRDLVSLDRASAEAIGPHNGRRLVRALEVATVTGEPVSGRLPAEAAPWRPTTVIRLGIDRADLVERLDRRVERMWSSGLLDEVALLAAHGLRDGSTATRAIGYAQALDQLDGVLTRDEAVTATQALTRRYARRQVSWFRRYEDAVDLDPRDGAATRDVVQGLVRAAVD
ncbi:tRNA (adenosine(37)-N6)-dimethylallyltransferase MiaA [Cnuibacter physcomitrellae]|uniref:tRNA (adenosine(37)-N6)-dimethylallyltransferase MiaA n=1 Tax=Cnuibacter physcomitrellae TaxID=1619308 RepID=UPI0026B7D7E5